MNLILDNREILISSSVCITIPDDLRIAPSNDFELLYGALFDDLNIFHILDQDNADHYIVWNPSILVERRSAQSLFEILLLNGLVGYNGLDRVESFDITLKEIRFISEG